MNFISRNMAIIYVAVRAFKRIFRQLMRLRYSWKCKLFRVSEARAANVSAIHLLRHLVKSAVAMAPSSL